MRLEIPSCRGPKPQGTSKSPLDNEHLYNKNMNEIGKCEIDQHVMTIPPNGSHLTAKIENSPTDFKTMPDTRMQPHPPSNVTVYILKCSLQFQHCQQRTPPR
jgi:hypothetical protein